MLPMPVEEKAELCTWLSSVTNGATPAKLVNICQEAAFFSLREDVDNLYVKKEHFLRALGK